MFPIGQLVKQTPKPLRNSTATHINSYNSHKCVFTFIVIAFAINMAFFRFLRFVMKFLDPNMTATAEFVKGFYNLMKSLLCPISNRHYWTSHNRPNRRNHRCEV